MATTISDGMVGAMATDIARNKPDSRAPTLLVNATGMTQETEQGYAGLIRTLVLHLPVDFYDLLDSESKADIIEAAERAGVACEGGVQQRLAPEAQGWRDRLAELEDWGSDQELAGTWEVIDGRLSGLKTLLAHSVTPDDLADVGRRCRELMIAAANATYRASMLPEGKEPPKDSDAKTKSKYIIASLGDGSVNKRLTKLIDRAWDLSVGLSHNPEPPRIATFAAAQATILVVRTLERIEADLDG